MKLIDKLAALRGWRYYLICALIGLVGIAGHAPYHIWPITIFVFAIIFRLIAIAPTLKRAFWTGQIAGTGYFFGQIYWVASAFLARGEGFIWIMPILVGGLALLLASVWGVAGWVFRRFKSKTAYPYVTLALLLYLAEFVRGHLFGGFPWNLPGYIFKAGNTLSQSAAIFGIYGLSLLVLLVSALLARSVWEKSLLPGALAAGLIFANLGYGAWRLSSVELQYVDGVNLRIVNVPFSQKDRLDPENPELDMQIVQDFINLSSAPGLENITHVIWPEGAIDGYLMRNRFAQLRAAMGATLKSADQSPPIWLVNSSRVEINPAGSDSHYNTSFALTFDKDPLGTVVATSDKKRLVPFGEIIPGGKFVERFGAKVVSADIGSFTPAPEKTLSRIPGLPTGSVQICYEVIFSGLTPRSKTEDVKWILNQSNDAWFGAAVGPEQHANIARYRAIEERVPLIRSASNGYSGVIDPYGRYVTYAKPHARQAIDSRLPQSLRESLPLSWISWLIALICLVLVPIPVRRRDNK
ncbi:MAG: apolipoprotein N-acyltransferase [Hellea sp.]|nr:apolipoprotein N-acyltransferase [Hellea sp.]